MCPVFFLFVIVEIFEIPETLGMSSKQLGEMFDVDSADMSGRKFPLMAMWG